MGGRANQIHSKSSFQGSANQAHWAGVSSKNWFIDTNYNGESFFVRHAYFCGGQEPYDSLKRSLRAEIDEAAWLALYQTTSMPFDPPGTGRIAVKVINHYGDEVLKVYEV